MGITVRPVTAADRSWVRAFLARGAGSSRQARRGTTFDAVDLPGFVAEQDGEPVALATYLVDGDSCELATLHASVRHEGVGTGLLEAVTAAAQSAGCRRLWLITTNDNLDAIRFYQRRGFRLAAAYPGAVDEARRTLKPEIPLVGEFGIPLRDELEFSKDL